MLVGNLEQRALVAQVKAAMRAASPLPVESLNAPAALRGIDYSDHLNYWENDFPRADGHRHRVPAEPELPRGDRRPRLARLRAHGAGRRGDLRSDLGRWRARTESGRPRCTTRPRRSARAGAAGGCSRRRPRPRSRRTPARCSPRRGCSRETPRPAARSSPRPRSLRVAGISTPIPHSTSATPDRNTSSACQGR